MVLFLIDGFSARRLRSADNCIVPGTGATDQTDAVQKRAENSVRPPRLHPARTGRAAVNALPGKDGRPALSLMPWSILSRAAWENTARSCSSNVTPSSAVQKKGRTHSVAFGTEFTRQARHVLALLQAPLDVARSVWSFPSDLRAMELLLKGLESTVQEHYRRKGVPCGRARADGDSQK